jgi:hypothetical protein
MKLLRNHENSHHEHMENDIDDLVGRQAFP